MGWLTPSEIRALISETERLAGIERDPLAEYMRAVVDSRPPIAFCEEDVDDRWEYYRYQTIGGLEEWIPLRPRGGFGPVDREWGYAERAVERQQVTVEQSSRPITILKTPDASVGDLDFHFDGRDERLDAYDADSHKLVGRHIRDGAPVYQSRPT